MITPAPVKSAINFGNQGVQLTTLDDAWRFSQYVIASKLAPKGLDNPEAVLIVLQLGAEVGLTPMSALQNIAAINGRPAIFGDAALALVRASGLMESYIETEIGEKGAEGWGFRITTKRKGMESQTESFTAADAKAAKLWNKPGPWSEYPKRMLKFRCRGFLLRDVYSDILKGLRTVEEVRDIPLEPKNVTPPTSLVAALEAAKPAAELPAEHADIMPTPGHEPAATSTGPAIAVLPTRSSVITSIESHMLALGVSESRVWNYAQEEFPDACLKAVSLFALPTEVLAEIKDAVPAMAKTHIAK